MLKFEWKYQLDRGILGSFFDTLEKRRKLSRGLLSNDTNVKAQ